MTRKGHRNSSGTSFGVMDDLHYYYNANQLHSVTDSSGVTTGFKDGNASDSAYSGGNGNDDFKYDVNGNMTKDANKGITNITYNHLNLPTQVTINGQNITYTYDATGTKLRKVVSGVTTEYAGNYIYNNNNLQFFNTSEGYFNVTSTSGYVQGNYVYQYKDHLGNVRLSYTDKNKDGDIDVTGNPDTDEIVEESNYYPFGLKHKGYNNVVTSGGNSVAQKWGFGGKEFSEELGLKTYDFGARNYDPSLGRWFVIDPKSDDVMQVDLTPYNYSWNNPVNVADPDGECPWCWGAVIGALVEYGSQVAGNLANGQSLGDALTDVDGGKIAIATATGAATGGLSTLKAVGVTAKFYKGLGMTTTVVAGSAANQYKDGKKTIDLKETAIDVVADKLPIPGKIKIKGPSKAKIKTANRKLDRAERVNRSNNRVSRQNAVKKAKKDVTDLTKKAKAAKTAQKNVNELKDSAVKQGFSDAMKKKALEGLQIVKEEKKN